MKSSKIVGQADKKLCRTPDWPARLRDWVAEARGTAFEWGRNDCLLFAASAVAALTGSDPGAAWRGRYRSATGAARVLVSEFGAADLALPITAALGPPLARPRLAMRGDIVLLQSSALDPATVIRGDPRVAGVCLGHNAAVPGAEGLQLVPMPAVAAWRVPF